MKISAEISLYPLTKQYDGIVLEFVKQLHAHPGLQLSINGMSTQLTGESKDVFTAIHDSLHWCFDRKDVLVAVVKYLNREITPNQPYDI
jgi:uncharacterized protein YqgV (UPF0045/DUF77 family)